MSDKKGTPATADLKEAGKLLCSGAMFLLRGVGKAGYFIGKKVKDVVENKRR